MRAALRSKQMKVNTHSYLSFCVSPPPHVILLFARFVFDTPTVCLSVCVQDMTAAAHHLRHAKGLDPMVSAAKSGIPIDITKVCGSSGGSGWWEGVREGSKVQICV